LDATSAKTISFGPNVAIVGGVPPLSWGLGVSYSRDKIAGVETQTKTIKEALSGSNGIMKNVVNTLDLKQDMKDSVTTISDLLEAKFGKTSPEELRQAAENIYTGLLYFGLTKESTPEQKQNVVDLMTEFYVQSWRNDAMTGMENKAYISSVGI
jgi:hypothetical protein